MAADVCRRGFGRWLVPSAPGAGNPAALNTDARRGITWHSLEEFPAHNATEMPSGDPRQVLARESRNVAREVALSLGQTVLFEVRPALFGQFLTRQGVQFPLPPWPDDLGDRSQEFRWEHQVHAVVAVLPDIDAWQSGEPQSNLSARSDAELVTTMRVDVSVTARNDLQPRVVGTATV